MTIQDYLAWLEMRKLSPNTILAARSDLHLVQDAIKKPIIQVTERDLRNYLQEQSHLKASSITRKIANLKGYFNLAQRQGRLRDNPTANLVAPKAPKRNPVYLSRGEVELLTTYQPRGRAKDIRDAVLVKFLFYSGMRIGEALAVNIQDVDFREGEIRVIGKGNKERLVPLSDSLAAVLETWQKYRMNLKELSTSAMFPTIGGARIGYRMSHDTAVLAVRNGLKLMGIDAKKYTPHKLRHSCATAMLRAEVPFEQISQILGHSNLNTTMIYAHTERSQLRKAVNVL